MKKNNKKVHEAKPRAPGKAKFLGKMALLMLLIELGAPKGFAGDGVVVSKRIHPSIYGGSYAVYGIDQDNNGRADFYIQTPGVTGLYAVLLDLMEIGAVIVYDDNAQIVPLDGLPYMNFENILSIDGEDILDIFPHAGYLFTAAARRRAEAARQGQRTR